MSDATFVSSNTRKASEVLDILHQMGMHIDIRTAVLAEMQSDSLEEIAAAKAAAARDLVGGPALVEDDGLFIHSLGGFPGPYSSYVFDTIGNKGILRLLSGVGTAVFCAVVAYSDSEHAACFRGEVPGRIAAKPQGDGWGYDPIFMPDGAGGTFAQIDKNLYSHRRAALADFVQWHQNTFQ